MPFKQAGINYVNYIIIKVMNKTELAQYLHRCAFSPVSSTFQDCRRRGNFIPGINTLNLKKLIQTTEATIKGHQDQEQNNYRQQSNHQLPHQKPATRLEIPFLLKYLQKHKRASI